MKINIIGYNADLDFVTFIGPIEDRVFIGATGGQTMLKVFEIHFVSGSTIIIEISEEDTEEQFINLHKEVVRCWNADSEEEIHEIKIKNE